MTVIILYLSISLFFSLYLSLTEKSNIMQATLQSLFYVSAEDLLKWHEKTIYIRVIWKEIISCCKFERKLKGNLAWCQWDRLLVLLACVCWRNISVTCTKRGINCVCLEGKLLTCVTGRITCVYFGEDITPTPCNLEEILCLYLLPVY